MLLAIPPHYYHFKDKMIDAKVQCVGKTSKGTWTKMCLPEFNWNSGVERAKSTKKLKPTVLAHSMNGMNAEVAMSTQMVEFVGENSTGALHEESTMHKGVGPLIAQALPDKPAMNRTMTFPAEEDDLLTILLDDSCVITMSKKLMMSDCSADIKTRLQSVSSITLSGWPQNRVTAVVLRMHSVPIKNPCLLPGAIDTAHRLGISGVVRSFASDLKDELRQNNSCVTSQTRKLAAREPLTNALGGLSDGSSRSCLVEMEKHWAA
jgi:hypothetical protein